MARAAAGRPAAFDDREIKHTGAAIGDNDVIKFETDLRKLTLPESTFMDIETRSYSKPNTTTLLTEGAQLEGNKLGLRGASESTNVTLSVNSTHPLPGSRFASRVLLVVLHISLMLAFVLTHVSCRDVQLILAATASQQLGQGTVLVWWSSYRYWLCERVKRLQFLFQFSANLISGADNELGWQSKTDSRVRHDLLAISARNVCQYKSKHKRYMQHDQEHARGHTPEQQSIGCWGVAQPAMSPKSQNR